MMTTTNPSADWYDDPTTSGQLRYWDGSRWTDHVATAPQPTPSPTQSPTPTPAPVPAASPTPSGPPRDRGFVAETIVWLGPVIVLGGAGLALFDAGSEESTGQLGMTETAVSGTGWVGAALVAFAAAWFFGRGTIRSLTRIVTGRAGVGDVLFAPSNVKFLLLSAAATAAGCFALVMAAGGGS